MFNMFVPVLVLLKTKNAEKKFLVNFLKNIKKTNLNVNVL